MKNNNTNGAALAANMGYVGSSPSALGVDGESVLIEQPASEAAVAWPPGNGEMAARVRAFDWASTPLGPSAGWPDSLRTTVEIVLAGGFPMVALWGPDLVQIYNDGYRIVMGPKHPEGLGQPTRDCWPEVWDVNAPIYERVRAGETLSFEDALFRVDRDGGVADAWFTLSYSPLRDQAAVAGVLVIVSETTERVRASMAAHESEERHVFLLRLTDALRPLTDARQVVARATQMLGDYMQADRCFIAEMDRDGVNLDVYEEHLRPGASSVIGHHNFDSFGVFVSPELSRGNILAVEDIATLDLTEAERAHYAAVGIAAYLLIPLVRDGWFAACLAVNHQTPHKWSEADRAVTRQVADRTWAAVERARVEAALRESEALQRIAMDSGGMGAWLWDLRAGLIRGDPAFLALYGVAAHRRTDAPAGVHRADVAG